MCHPPRKIVTINQLIKIGNSRINYSGENKIVLTLGYNLKENIAPFAMFPLNFFQNLENINIVCIFFMNEFSFYSCFQTATFCISNIYHIPHLL